MIEGDPVKRRERAWRFVERVLVGAEADAVVPDREGRVEGTSYPADDRAPEGSRPLGRRPPRPRELLASLLLGTAVRVVRARPGEVLVLSGDELHPFVSRHPESLALLQRALSRQHGGRPDAPVAVFLPGSVRVHVEPRKAADDISRAYRETGTYGSDRGAPSPEVFTGVPEPEQESPMDSDKHEGQAEEQGEQQAAQPGVIATKDRNRRHIAKDIIDGKAVNYRGYVVALEGDDIVAKVTDEIPKAILERLVRTGHKEARVSTASGDQQAVNTALAMVDGALDGDLGG